MKFPTCAALLGLVGSALAIDLTFYLPPKPNPFTLPPSTHATLSALHESYTAPVSTLNTFVFRNVTAPGSYLVDVHSPTDAFRPLRVDVTLPAEGGEPVVEAWETYRGNDWGNKGEALVAMGGGSAGTGFELRGMGSKNYFQERPKFSVMTILKNPMILMGLVSMVMFVGMPKLMENMDPEMRAEFEARQAQGPLASLMGGGAGGSAGGQENPVGDFDMAAYLAGSKNGGSAKGQGGGAVKRG